MQGDGEVASGLVIDRVLHPTDLTDAGRSAFVHAVRIAVAVRAQLDIVNVNPTPEAVSWSDYPRVRELLARWKLVPEGASSEEILKLGLGVAKLEVRGHSPTRGLLSEIDRHQPDLVVFATRGRGGIDRLLGRDVAQPVAQRAGVLSLFVPVGRRGFVSAKSGGIRLRRVLLPVAEMPPPAAAVRALRGLVGLLDVAGVTAELLHVGDADSAPNLEPRDDARLRWSYEIRPGEPVAVVRERAAAIQADLIVLVTEGRQGLLDALRGSTSERILAGARRPVLAVPAGAS